MLRKRFAAVLEFYNAGGRQVKELIQPTEDIPGI